MSRQRRVRPQHTYLYRYVCCGAADYGRRLLKQLREGASAMSLTRLFHGPFGDCAWEERIFVSWWGCRYVPELVDMNSSGAGIRWCEVWSRYCHWGPLPLTHERSWILWRKDKRSFLTRKGRLKCNVESEKNLLNGGHFHSSPLKYIIIYTKCITQWALQNAAQKHKHKTNNHQMVIHSS